MMVGGSCLEYAVADLTPGWLQEPPTILFHHGIGATRGIWNGWLPALIDGYRIISFDMRGHGNSPWPGPGPAMELDRLADDALALLDALGVARAHLVGESMGGTILLNLALRAPARVASLTLSNATHIGSSITAVREWRRIIETQGMPAWSAHMMQARFFDGALPDLAWRWYEAQQAAVSPRAVLAGLDALVGADFSGRLDALHLPVLLLHPDSSPFIPVSLAADLKNRLADARLHVIGRARHGLPFSHADICAALLRRFLDEVPRAPS